MFPGRIPMTVSPSLIMVLLAVVMTGKRKLSTAIQIDFSYVWSQHTNQVLYIYDQLSQPDQSGIWTNDNVCRISMQQLVSDAKNQRYYANKMIDSVGRPTSGILEGRLTYLGQYDECIDATGSSFAGKYCIANIQLPRNFSFFLSNISGIRSSKYHNLPVKLGVCLPNTCSAQDVQTLVYKFSNMVRPAMSSVMIECVESNDGTAQHVDVISVSIFGGVCALLVLMVIIGTIYDHYHHKPDHHTYTLQGQLVSGKSSIITYTKTRMDNSRIEAGTTYKSIPDHSVIVKIFLAFSAKQNVKKILFVLEPTGNGQSIDVFHGIRFFAMIWVIFIHSYTFSTLWINFDNQVEMKSNSYNAFSQVFMNGSFSVDSFFFMSGFLVMYNIKRLMDSNKWNLTSFYLSRYIRMTPVILFVIAFGAIMLRYLNSGPEWTANTALLDLWCRRNWWLNILYVNNFFRTENMCLGVTWYSATDFQFFLISPLLAYLLLRWQVIGLMVTGLMLIGSVAITWALTEINNYPGVPYSIDIVPPALMNGYYKDIYIKPYCRIGPYLVGFLLAHFMFSNNNTPTMNTKPSKSFLLGGWLFTLVCTVGIILAMPVYGINGQKPNQHMASAYSAISRTIWGLGLAWITYVSIVVPNGIVQRFLSLKIWVPGSRLSFCAFVSHLIVIVLFYGTRTQTFDYSFYLILYFSLSNIFISFMVAFVLAVVVEFPFITIGKMVINRIF